MPVERAIGAADHIRADMWQALFHLGMIEEFDLVIGRAGLVVEAEQARLAGLHLRIAERKMKPAGPAMMHVDAGLAREFLGKVRPVFRGPYGPAGIFRHAESLGLHPDQREIRAARAFGKIALIEHRRALAEPTKAPGNSGAEQAATDHGNIVFRAGRAG